MGGCGKCRGVWVDRKAFEKICKPAASPRETRVARASAAQRLKCPICYYWMDARNFGNSSELIIDICRRHGTWLDSTELQAILRNSKRPNGAEVNASPSTPSMFATTAAIGAASTATAIAPPDRSTLERAGEIVFDLLDFADCIDMGDLGDIADILGCIAEISFSLFDGV